MLPSAMARSEAPSEAASPAPNPATITAEYRGLAARIDAFFAAVLSRHSAAMQCQAGCSGCCQDGLSVSAIEASNIRDYLGALPDLMRQAIRQRANRDEPPTRETPAEPQGETSRCVFLDEGGRCAIYPVRPLVCRSQGLPLMYAAELVPAAALRFSARDGRAVVCCPLNFADAPVAGVPADGQPTATAPAPPGGADILDAERIDLLLALLNRRYVSSLAHNQPQTATDAALARTPLAALARGEI